MSANNNDNKIEPRCLNCDASLGGAYCATCGQKHIEGTLTLSFFVQTFVAAITNTDSRFLRTFKELIIQPGYLAKRYVAGNRKQYIDPVKLSFIIIGAYLAILAVNGWISPAVENTPLQTNSINESPSFFSIAFYKAWYELYSNHRLFIYIGAMPFAAIAIKYTFYKSQYNYVATLILLLYVSALYSFYGILLVTIYSTFEFDFFSVSRKIAETIIGLGIYFQSVKSFYNFGWIKSVGATLWILILLMIAAYLVTFAASWVIVAMS